MKRYDRYLIARLLTFVALVVLVLLMIFVIVDFSEKTDDFTDRGAAMSDIIFRYYIPYIPEIVWRWQRCGLPGCRTQGLFTPISL